MFYAGGYQPVRNHPRAHRQRGAAYQHNGHLQLMCVGAAVRVHCGGHPQADRGCGAAGPGQTADYHYHRRCGSGYHYILRTSRGDQGRGGGERGGLPVRRKEEVHLAVPAPCAGRPCAVRVCWR